MQNRSTTRDQSPFLFDLFITDAESFLITSNNIGVSTISNEIEHELGILLRLLIILYADDTVLLSETPEDLQNQLNSFLLYCQQWKLEVNIEKTKIVIFTKGRVKNNVFYYNGKEIEIVKNFKYLGVIFSSSGSFIQTNALLRLVKTGSRGKKQNGSMSDNRKFIG